MGRWYEHRQEHFQLSQQQTMELALARMRFALATLRCQFISFNPADISGLTAAASGHPGAIRYGGLHHINTGSRQAQLRQSVAPVANIHSGHMCPMCPKGLQEAFRTLCRGSCGLSSGVPLGCHFASASRKYP